MHAAQPNAMSAHAEGFPPAHAGTGAGASGQFEELQGFSKHLLAKLDESRNMGQFSQAEIELLRKKLSVVVNAFSAERAKIEGELSTVRVSSARGDCAAAPASSPRRGSRTRVDDASSSSSSLDRARDRATFPSLVVLTF